MRKFLTIFILLSAICLVLYFWLNSPYKYLVNGNTLIKSGKVAKAVTILEEGANKFPNNEKLFFSLARAYLLTGDIDKANEIFLKRKIFADNNKKNNIKVKTFIADLAEANWQSGNSGIARFLGEKYLECYDPLDSSIYTVKNSIKISQVIPEKSIELLESSYKIAKSLKNIELKNNVKALILPRYFQEVEKLKKEKKYDEALNVLKSADVLGKNPEVSYQKAIICVLQGKSELSHKNFEDALQLEPQNQKYKISYAEALSNAANKTQDSERKSEYTEKVKLLLAGNGSD